jgi:hypothetical protein
MQFPSRVRNAIIECWPHESAGLKFEIGVLALVDFFVSYTSADTRWAEWIAYVLEEAGSTVIIQAWDFRPGSNFVLEMQDAASKADRTLMVLSPDYLKSQFASPEWASAFARDPQGLTRKLVPVMVRQCNAPGMLASIVRINLEGTDEATARDRLIKGIGGGRAKPTTRPMFPGSAHVTATPYPGDAAAASAPQRRAYIPTIKRALSDVDKRRFSRGAFDTIKAHFKTGLEEAGSRGADIDVDFQESSPTDFTAELFVGGKSRCRTRIRMGVLHQPDGISVSEGASYLSDNGYNEMLSVTDVEGTPYLNSQMGMGFGSATKGLNLKQMTPEQAADYLWRRFISPLER